MQTLSEKLEQINDWGGMKKDIVCLVLSGISLLISLAFPDALPVNPAWVAIILCGIPIILEAIAGLVSSFDIKADVLVSLALIASVCIGEIFAAGEVAFIMQLGALLEEITVARARAGIEKLVHLTPQTARILQGEQETIIPAENVRVGDLLRVLPGEIIPVDGIIRKGQTTINQAVMTGEPIPVDKAEGDTVYSGTVNQFGAFEMEALYAGTDSSIQRMIRLVQSADAGRAKIVRLADRWATWIVVIALSAAILTWLITGEIIRAVTILVVFCPCALVLATPTAIMAAIGNATRHGFLVRIGDALERLASVRVITFDKTGTLTYGKPDVASVQSFLPSLTEEALYTYTAAAEQYSEHPLGKAIVSRWRQTHTAPLPAASDFALIAGRGVRATVSSHEILAGNPALFAEHGVSLPQEMVQASETRLSRGETIIYIAQDGVAAGYLSLADQLRPESAPMIAALQSLGISPMLLTGDHEQAAQAIASTLHISQVRAGCLPEDKMAAIDQCQNEGRPVCMIGDGINDAPALKKANVGIAMGGIGSDIAVDAADIVLVNDELYELPHLLALSRRMMSTIRVNLTFSMLLNFLSIILAIWGKIDPILGALVHNAGSVLVIANSALLLKWKK